MMRLVMIITAISGVLIAADICSAEEPTDGINPFGTLEDPAIVKSGGNADIFPLISFYQKMDKSASTKDSTV
jgi:hypothetical protein